MGFNGGFPNYLAAVRNHSQTTDLIRREVDGNVRTYITNLPFTLDPIPLDVVEKSITTLNQARLTKKQVFIMGENGSHLLASLIACDLAKDKEPDSWTIFQMGWTPEENELTAVPLATCHTSRSLSGNSVQSSDRRMF